MLVEERKKDFVEAFHNVVNNFLGRDDAIELADAVCTDHRTLLQSKMSVCLEVIRFLANDYKAGYYDARNEQACKVADKIVKALDDTDFYFPMI